MAFVEDLTPFFADFGESVTVAGVAARGIFDQATQLELGDMLVQAPALQVPASVAAGEGAAVTVRGVAYTVRQVIDMPPDGVIRQLVLARAG